MNLPDLVNGTLITCGALLYSLNVRKVWKDKKIRGVSVWPVLFFTGWGVWDFYYFPHLEQWFSLAGSIVAVTTNSTWLALAFRYRKN